MKKLMVYGLVSALTVFASASVRAGEETALNTRYGLFNGLDHRSSYGQGVFPEPFLVDDSDQETRELRFDWLHTANGADHSDNAKAEIEYGFGLLTLELEVPYERDVADGMTVSGLANIDVGARYPFFQLVSKRGLVDTTFGTAMEIGIPTTSAVSHDAEFVPKIFNDTRIGDFTVQSVAGYSILAGPDEDGGLDTFEYGFTLGYAIPHKAMPLPGIDRLIPILELSGETALNHDSRGQNSLTGGVGLRANLKTIGRVQARPGILFVFPVDNGAHAETHWGIMTSFVFEF
ncbi:MAG TPA: hypothetical protein VK815_18715 [Candidatus Acidoferrales bacterium]|nr:hypothetical protein [Candidatus Acidoferrales bacterium]